MSTNNTCPTQPVDASLLYFLEGTKTGVVTGVVITTLVWIAALKLNNMGR